MNDRGSGTQLHRRDAILRIVRAQAVPSQDELGRLLRAEGFAVAQPTLSRDVRELGLAKGPGGYAVAAETGSLPPAPDLRARRQEALDQALRDYAKSVATAGSLVVVKTPVAEASPLARAIDESMERDAVGTVAGDDTILVATPGPAAAARLAGRLLRPLRPRAPRRPRA